ncbi:hypothetical protein LCGC14_1049380 [marine sediment metagenome]|uniref:Uncharacterized protein n=1 Tax=marine sediment metagenome TaxID=412755 RepID=A0A0F9MPB5_9ZZZZ
MNEYREIIETENGFIGQTDFIGYEDTLIGGTGP